MAIQWSLRKIHELSDGRLQLKDEFFERNNIKAMLDCNKALWNRVVKRVKDKMLMADICVMSVWWKGIPDTPPLKFEKILHVGFCGQWGNPDDEPPYE
ncbi:hypothetical protein C8Q74DRAFT_1363479 [Fomes fomentarius]|nr:hypothetical protein C8Q74DRAFT_1363479 [Fomes fomentarius]